MRSICYVDLHFSHLTQSYLSASQPEWKSELKLPQSPQITPVDCTVCRFLSQLRVNGTIDRLMDRQVVSYCTACTPHFTSLSVRTVSQLSLIQYNGEQKAPFNTHATKPTHPFNRCPFSTVVSVPADVWTGRSMRCTVSRDQREAENIRGCF